MALSLVKYLGLAATQVGWLGTLKTVNTSMNSMLNNTSHSYIVYGPLIHGCTSVLYEGKPIKTPDVSFLSLSLISPLSSLSLTHAGGSILETYISTQSKTGICGTNLVESHKAGKLRWTTCEEIWYGHILVYRIGLALILHVQISVHSVLSLWQVRGLIPNRQVWRRYPSPTHHRSLVAD